MYNTYRHLRAARNYQKTSRQYRKALGYTTRAPRAGNIHKSWHVLSCWERILRNNSYAKAVGALDIQTLAMADPQAYASKIVEITFARVDLLPSNIFPQSNMEDFRTLRRLRVPAQYEYHAPPPAQYEYHAPPPAQYEYHGSSTVANLAYRKLPAMTGASSPSEILKSNTIGNI